VSTTGGYPAPDLGDRLVDQATRALRLRQVFDSGPDCVAVFHAVRDQDARVTGVVLEMANRAALSDTGWSPEHALGRDLRELLPQAEESGMVDRILAVLAGSAPWRGRRTMSAAGRARVLEGCTVLLDADTVLATWHDITEEAERQQLLERAYEDTAEMRATLQTALDATSDCFAVYALEWDAAGALTGLRVVHANAAASAVLGAEPDDLVGRMLHDVFPAVVSSGLWARIVEAAVTKAPQHYRVHRFDEAGGWLSAWDNTVAPVGEERITIMWRDASAEERALRQLAQHRDEAMHTATHDALTGLPNRIVLRDHLDDALRDCPPDRRVGIVFVDLDRFKAINDTYGHAAGDLVLCATARRLRRIVRQGDLAARLAGDEFVLVLTGLAPEWTPEGFFARAVAALTEPVQVEDVELHPGASLGVVVWDPQTGRTDVDELIKSADAAMYRAKAARGAAR
jgi:diguanylate cyclase (GGDEF)-like protein/PAS domain S-box-containing protein